MGKINQFMSLTLSAVTGGLVAVGSFYYLGEQNQNQMFAIQPNQAQVTHTKMPGSTAFEAVDFTSAAEQTVTGVVHVKTVSAGKEYYQINPLQYFFFGQADAVPRKSPDQLGSGSGVIISSDGYIVTNNHVVNGADEVTVVLNDNQSYKAEVVGKDASTDVALLKVDAKNLPVVPFGNSDHVKLGEWVLAVGNPYNLNSTVTAGIVSAKGRNINIMPTGSNNGGYAPIESFIQTDAAVNPGNSGGALVNTKGELVGINTAIKSPTGTFTGYSFAVPVNIVKKVVEDLKEYGVVQRGFIGVAIRDVNEDLLKEEDLSVTSGVYVSGLLDEGAAKDAGLEEGDVIVQVGTNAVKSVPELQEQIGRYRPGDEVSITVNRNGKTKQFPVVLKNKFGNTDLVSKEEVHSMSALGAEFEPLSAEIKNKLRVDHGIQVKKIDGGKLKSAGVKEGFIILRVDKEEINDVEDLNNAFAGKQGGILIEGVYPNGTHGYYGVGM